MRVGRVTLAHAVVSLFTRPPAGEATGVAMGTVDRGLLWFDADRTPASGIPGRSGPSSPGAPRGGEALRRSRRGARKAPARGADAMDDRSRGDPRDPARQERYRATAPASPTSREIQRIEEPRHEHCAHREPSGSRAPTARRHRTAPSFGNHGHGGRGVLPPATGQPGRHFAGCRPGGRTARADSRRGLPGTSNHPASAFSRTRDRGTRHHRAGVPHSLRGHLLHDGAVQTPAASTSIRSPVPTPCTSRSPSSPRSASETSRRPARWPAWSSSRR